MPLPRNVGPVQRKEYMKQLINFRDTPIIKVITGIRRCGKSTLFELYKEYLGQNGVPDDRIVSINFEDPDNEYLMDWRILYNHLKERLSPDQMTYIFLDEIQHVPDYQKAVDGLFVKKNSDLYITGSDAFMLSGELATLLSGRYVEIKMLPLSFAEYVSAMGGDNLSEKYNQYIMDSSFPYTLNISGQRKEVFDYLSGLYDTVVRKDITMRAGIRDGGVLDQTAKFMFDNVGNMLSPSNISKTFETNGRNVSVNTVDRYVRLLTESFLFYSVGRYDVKGLEHLKTLGKYYAVDLGLRFMMLGRENVDLGHILENVVFLELYRRGYRVSIGKIGNSEIDFVALSPSGMTEYYQVAYSTKDESTLERELTPLGKIKDHNAKHLLTMDDEPMTTYNGIKKINVLKWLLGQE